MTFFLWCKDTGHPLQMHLNPVQQVRQRTGYILSTTGEWGIVFLLEGKIRMCWWWWFYQFYPDYSRPMQGRSCRPSHEGSGWFSHWCSIVWSECPDHWHGIPVCRYRCRHRVCLKSRIQYDPGQWYGNLWTAVESNSENKKTMWDCREPW